MIAVRRKLARPFASLAAVLGLLLLPRTPVRAQEEHAPQGTREVIKNPLNDLLDQARQAIDRKDYQAAIAPLQKVIAAQDDFAYAHFQLAYVYTALQRSRDARSEYEKVIALDPKMPEARLNLGILLLDQDPAAAVPQLQKAVEFLPSQSRPRFLLGVALERSGNLPAAAQSYEGALRLDPKDSETTLHLAELYMKLNRPSDAEPKFRSALNADPKSLSALLGLAESLEAQKKPEAAGAYTNYLKLKPDDSAARAHLFHLLLANKDEDAALAFLDREEAGKPPSLEHLKLRADVQIGQKKWSDAVGTLKQALALAPNDAQLHGGLGRIYMQMREFPAAESELKTAIHLDQNNREYWKDIGSVYYLWGKYPAALAVFDAVAKVETPSAGMWFIRALCYDNLKQPKPALEAYQKFLAMDGEKNPDQIWQAKQRSEVLQRVLQGK
jgi:Flp pilus assembly protein TadD